MHSAFKRRSSVDVGVHSIRRLESQSLKACDTENDSLTESGETTFADFASLLDSALQGAFGEIMNIIIIDQYSNIFFSWEHDLTLSC